MYYVCIHCICVYAVLVCVYRVFLVLSIGLIAGIISRGIGIVKSTLFGRINKQHRRIAMQTCGANFVRKECKKCCQIQKKTGS